MSVRRRKIAEKVVRAQYRNSDYVKIVEGERPSRLQRYIRYRLAKES